MSTIFSVITVENEEAQMIGILSPEADGSYLNKIMNDFNDWKVYLSNAHNKSFVNYFLISDSSLALEISALATAQRIIDAVMLIKMNGQHICEYEVPGKYNQLPPLPDIQINIPEIKIKDDWN